MSHDYKYKNKEQKEPKLPLFLMRVFFTCYQIADRYENM